MESLISINFKFMSVSPRRLVNFVKASKYAKGFEVYFDFNDNFQVQYLIRLVELCMTENLILQIHGDYSLSINRQLECLKLVEEISDILKKQIVFTLHPLPGYSKEDSLKKTYEYVSEMLKNCDKNKVLICLENLNDSSQKVDRLNKEDITPIICNIEGLFMTYDIGHEMVEYGEITNLHPQVEPLVKNVHLHTFAYDKTSLREHRIITPNDKNWIKIVKSILYLKSINYDGNIVFEYELNFCKGDTVEEKIINYLRSIDFVSERF